MGIERCNFCATAKEARDLKRCANCKIAFYCSKECQKLHWKTGHKAACLLQTQISQELGEGTDEKAQVKKVNRWINAWSPVITACLPTALDLVNHQWGRHETHTLVITAEHTNLNEDAGLFRVTEAAIQSCADVVKLVPELERAVANPPEYSEWPRLRCLVFIKDKRDPTQMERARVHSWCVANLREVYSDLDKDYSRAAAKQAIPLLVREINELRKPEEAVRKFQLMVEAPDAVRPFLDVLNMGITDDDDEDDGELLQQYLEKLLGGGCEGDRGSGS